MTREKVTLYSVEYRASVVSAYLRGALNVQVQGRNGYFGLDLHDQYGVVKTLTTGTKREVYTYLGAMLETLYITGHNAPATYREGN